MLVRAKPRRFLSYRVRLCCHHVPTTKGEHKTKVVLPSTRAGKSSRVSVARHLKIVDDLSDHARRVERTAQECILWPKSKKKFCACS
jgi:hypothetical protein